MSAWLLVLVHCHIANIMVGDKVHCLYINSFAFSFSKELIPPGACNVLNPATIYANNEVNLDRVDIYGFDYDYTLALYSGTLDAMIYNTARDILIKHFKVCLLYLVHWIGFSW